MLLHDYSQSGSTMWRQCFLISFVLCQIQRRDAYRSSADEPATLKVQETGLEKDCSTKASLNLRLQDCRHFAKCFTILS